MEVVRMDTTEVPSLDGVIPESIDEPDTDLSQPGRPKKPKRILHPKEKAIMKKTEQTQNKKSSQRKSILVDTIPCDRNGFHGTPALTLSQQNLKKHF